MKHILIYGEEKLALDTAFELTNQLSDIRGSVQIVMGKVEPEQNIQQTLNTFAKCRAGIPYLYGVLIGDLGAKVEKTLEQYGEVYHLLVSDKGIKSIDIPPNHFMLVGAHDLPYLVKTYIYEHLKER